jgi:glycosyltransferase involved in cell wall biosynthesis
VSAEIQPPRPVRIDQVIPAIVEHDAVSNHTFAAQRLMREMGFDSEIYALIIGPGCEGRVRPLRELPKRDDGSQWVLYQCSIGSPAADAVVHHPGRKLLDYHNIVPEDLVEEWLPPLAEEARLGRRQLAALSSMVSVAFADSAFNAEELAEVGYPDPAVVPVLVESGNLLRPPDERVLERFRAAKAAGGTDWLFVGQIGPHKAQHDVVKAFAAYHRAYDERARLHIVGREMGTIYIDALRRFVASLGLSGAVEFPGSVPVGTLAAYYETADAFVCLSDHEGFCAPIVEAMARGTPVVAYAAAAVPETLGDAGVLLPEKSPALVASAVRRLVNDAPTRAAFVARGRERAKNFSPERAESAFRSLIESAIGTATESAAAASG